MTIFKRNSKTDLASAAQPLTMEQMETQVKDSLKSVGDELSRMEEGKQTRMDAANNWSVRIERVTKLIKLNPEKDEALEALNIMKAQAEDFHRNIVDTINVDDEHMAQLRDQKTQLTETLRTLERMKKKEALHGHLSKVSASLGDSSQEMVPSNSVEMEETARQVNRLIHNASALIELRSEKV